MNKWSYKFDSLNNEYFIKTLPTDSDDEICFIYKLAKNESGYFTLQFYQIKMFSKKSKTWHEIQPDHKGIDTLIKINNN